MIRWRFWRRKQRDLDLNDEIAFDLAVDAEERIRAGLAPEEAQHASHRDFGNVALLKEDVREAWGWTWIESLAQDVRYGWRTLRRNRLFTAMTVLSLALGIGANTAIYSVMDAILLRALPVRNPRELVILNWRAIKPPASGFVQPAGIRVVDGRVYQGPGGDRMSSDFPWPFYQLIQTGNDAFSTVFAYKDAGQLNLMVQGHAELGRVQFVSGNFFSALGVHSAVGRLIDDSDNRPGAPPGAVLGYAYWRGRFGGDPAVIGQIVQISSVPFTIVGIAAPEFFGLAPGSAPALYVPIVSRPSLARNTIGPIDQTSMFTDSHYYWADMMGRLRPGVTMERAQAQISARFRQFALAEGANEARGDLPALWLEEGGSGIDSLRRQYSKPLYVLMTMVALILAIACANIANLLLARAAARRREMGLRLSLGASRLRVVRQLLTESLLLALTGGIPGLGIAAAGIRFLLWRLAAGSRDFQLRAELDLPVLAFTIAVALITGILFGLAPALEATRVSIVPALNEARAGSSRGHGRIGLGHILVVTQIALSFLLVLGAALFVRTLAGLQAVELGFNAENVITFNLNASKAGYNGAALTAFYSRMEERLRELPGVRGATVMNAPLTNGSFRTPFLLAANQKGGGGWCSVGPTFFDTMQIPIMVGRGIDSRDVDGAPLAAVVNEMFATKYFPNQNPVGQRVGILDGSVVTIVGVAKNARDSLKDKILPFAYISYRQNLGLAAWRGMFFEVRTMGDPLALAGTIRKAVHDAAPAVPIADMMTESQRIDNSIAQERTFADLCTAFAVLALIIACVGLYGSIAYAVSRRTNEIGIRMALGARQQGIVWMVLREVLALALTGLAIGAAGTWIAMPAIQSLLFGVRPVDPPSILLATGILIGALFLAGYAPAARASRIDPIAALRQE